MVARGHAGACGALWQQMNGLMASEVRSFANTATKLASRCSQLAPCLSTTYVRLVLVKTPLPVLYTIETGATIRLIIPMSRPGHYSPCINRELVRTLYHEAKHRRMPMTRLVDALLADALTGSAGWQITHQTSLLQEAPPDYRSGKSTAP